MVIIWPLTQVLQGILGVFPCQEGDSPVDCDCLHQHISGITTVGLALANGVYPVFAISSQTHLSQTASPTDPAAINKLSHHNENTLKIFPVANGFFPKFQ